MSDQPRRYRQHPLLAAYAHEKLDDVAPAERRFIHYYHAFVRDNIADYTALLASGATTKAALEMAHRLQEHGNSARYIAAICVSLVCTRVNGDARSLSLAALAAP